MPRDLSCTLRQVVCGSWLSEIKEKLNVTVKDDVPSMWFRQQGASASVFSSSEFKDYRVGVLLLLG